MNKSSKWIFGILILALILRLALVVSVQGHFERANEPDTASYTTLASRLVNGEGFIDDPHRTPVYPLFIAFFYWVFGEQPLPIIFAQIILSLLTVYMTYIIGKGLLSETAGILAALLMAISIESITNAFFILTETIFATLFIGSLLSYIIFRKSRKRRWILFSGLLMGLAVLCRPIATYFTLLFIFLILIDQAKDWGERIINSLLYAAATMALIIPWIIWNYASAGIATISTISNYNLLFYNAASLQANQSGLSEGEIRETLKDQVAQLMEQRGLSDTIYNRDLIYKELALKIIFSDPIRYSCLHLKSDLNNLLPGVTDLTEILGITVGGKGTLAVLNKDGLMAAIRHYFEDKAWLIGIFAPAIILLVLTYLTGLAGIGILIKDRNWFALEILLLPIIYLLLIPGAPSNQRFRAPAMPYICLLAAQGSIFLWYSAKSIYSKKSNGRITPDRG